MVSALFNLLIFLLALGFLYTIKSKITQLGYRVLFGLVLGIGYGLLLKDSAGNQVFELIKGSLFIMGHGYLNLLKMLVIPLILTSIIHSLLNLGSFNRSSLKKMSVLATVMLLSMTAFSSLIGIEVGQLFHVGQGLNFSSFPELPNHPYTGFVNTIMGMLPSNPILAMTQENTIAVVLFAVLIGIAANKLDKIDHDKLEMFKNGISVLFLIVKKLTSLILSFTPYSVFALMALLILDQGVPFLSGILNFIVAMYAAMILTFLMHSLILVLFKQSPLKYFKKAYAPLFVAFTTRSSFATLPMTEETLRNQFKTTQMAATFIPSIGATMGMNACAGVFPAMLVVMTLAILHQPLTLHITLMVMFINMIASLGISGLPGTAYIAATVTLSSLNLPYAIVALVQGVDPIIDMGRTATNVNGVLTTAIVVDKFNQSEGRD